MICCNHDFLLSMILVMLLLRTPWSWGCVNDVLDSWCHVIIANNWCYENIWRKILLFLLLLLFYIFIDALGVKIMIFRIEIVFLGVLEVEILLRSVQAQIYISLGYNHAASASPTLVVHSPTYWRISRLTDLHFPLCTVCDVTWVS